MDREYLATGFADVDRTQNKEDYFSCLALLDSLPYYRGYKTRSYDLLDLGPGMAVLDAGCGLGDDAVRMARRVSPGGRVIGLDASGAMIEKARANPLCGALPVEFLKGDIKALPFADESFARCRIDRTLQHLSNPQKAIDELVRVFKALRAPAGVRQRLGQLFHHAGRSGCYGNDHPAVARLFSECGRRTSFTGNVHRRRFKRCENLFRNVGRH